MSQISKKMKNNPNIIITIAYNKELNQFVITLSENNVEIQRVQTQFLSSAIFFLELKVSEEEEKNKNGK